MERSQSKDIQLRFQMLAVSEEDPQTKVSWYSIILDELELSSTFHVQNTDIHII